MSLNTDIIAPIDSPGAPAKRSIWRLIITGGVLAAAILIVTLSPLRAFLKDDARVRAAIESLGIWAYPACVLGSAVLVACGIPRLLLCGLGAMALGFAWGLALTQAGALIGYYCIFLFVRWGGRKWVTRRWPALAKWAQKARNHGIIGVILVRQIPLHGTLTNLALGLSNVRHRHFLIGSGIGLLPEAIPVALVGAGLVSGSDSQVTGYLALAVAAMALLWIGGGYALRTLRSTPTGAAIASEAPTFDSQV